MLTHRLQSDIDISLLSDPTQRRRMPRKLQIVVVEAVFVGRRVGSGHNGGLIRPVPGRCPRAPVVYVVVFPLAAETVAVSEVEAVGLVSASGFALAETGEEAGDERAEERQAGTDDGDVGLDQAPHEGDCSVVCGCC